jgi:hypothetical protein
MRTKARCTQIIEEMPTSGVQLSRFCAHAGQREIEDIAQQAYSHKDIGHFDKKPSRKIHTQ